MARGADLLHGGELDMMVMAADTVNVIAIASPLIIDKDGRGEGMAILDQALEVADMHAKG